MPQKDKLPKPIRKAAELELLEETVAQSLENAGLAKHIHVHHGTLDDPNNQYFIEYTSAEDSTERPSLRCTRFQQYIQSELIAHFPEVKEIEFWRPHLNAGRKNLWRAELALNPVAQTPDEEVFIRKLLRQIAESTDKYNQKYKA